MKVTLRYGLNSSGEAFTRECLEKMAEDINSGVQKVPVTFDDHKTVEPESIHAEVTDKGLVLDVQFGPDVSLWGQVFKVKVGK